MRGTSLDFTKVEMGRRDVRSSEDPLASVFGWLRDGEIAAAEAEGGVWKDRGGLHSKPDGRWQRAL